MAPLLRVDLGRVDYDEALALQRDLVERRRRGEGQDTLLLCEHDEVVTTGRKAQRGPPEALDEVVAAGLRVVEVERGGAATWHGPGQLVGYPILRLAEGERDLHRVLRAIEDAVAAAVTATTGLPAGPSPGLTGVWVPAGDGPGRDRARKVASIGIACRGWVTYHGFALNLDVDTARQRLFRPCDLDASVMASLRELGAAPDRDALSAAIHAGLAARLGRGA